MQSKPKQAALCPGCLGAVGKMRCGGCLAVWYCGKECQKLHWKGRGCSAAPGGETEPPHKQWCTKRSSTDRLGSALASIIGGKAGSEAAFEALQDMRLRNSEPVYEAAEAAGLHLALVAGLSAEATALDRDESLDAGSFLQTVMNCLFATRRVLPAFAGGEPFYIRQGNAATDPGRVLRLLEELAAWPAWLAAVEANLSAHFRAPARPAPAAYVQGGWMHPSRQTIVPRDLLCGTISPGR
jgi:hypothetical protein